MKLALSKNCVVAALVAGTIVMSSYWAVTAAQPISVVDYPENYRTWQHVKSMIIQPGHPLEDPFGGMHHVYANTKAMKGLTSGQYEDGAVLVFDLLDYIEADNTIVESTRKRIDVMQYDSTRFSETDNWGYSSFVGDSKTERVDQDVVTACFGCHASTKNTNYVFSELRP